MNEVPDDNQDHNFDCVNVGTVPPKPQMPAIPAPSLTQQVKNSQEASMARAQEEDLAFLNDIAHYDQCPEYNGYLARTSREQGHRLQPKTRVVYLPLIDKSPADPGTIYVSLQKAQSVCDSIGQEFVIYTADQQLYKVALHLQWHDN